MSHTRDGIPLDQISVCRKYLVLTTHNNNNRNATMRRRNSKPQTQQVSGLGLTTWTLRAPEWANMTRAP